MLHQSEAPPDAMANAWAPPPAGTRTCAIECCRVCVFDKGSGAVVHRLDFDELARERCTTHASVLLKADTCDKCRTAIGSFAPALFLHGGANHRPRIVRALVCWPCATEYMLVRAKAFRERELAKTDLVTAEGA